MEGSGQESCCKDGDVKILLDQIPDSSEISLDGHVALWDLTSPPQQPAFVPGSL